MTNIISHISKENHLTPRTAEAVSHSPHVTAKAEDTQRRAQLPGENTLGLPASGPYHTAPSQRGRAVTTVLQYRHSISDQHHVEVM